MEENDLLKKTVQILEKENQRLEEHIQPIDEEDTEPPIENEDTEIKCTKCEYRTKNHTHMTGHQVIHKTHGCSKYSKQFNSKHALNQHVNDKHTINLQVGHPKWETEQNLSAKIKCSDCAQMFDNNTNLEYHMKDVHSDYSCIQCGEVFTTKNYISRHKENDKNNQFHGLAAEHNQMLPTISCQQCDYETNTNNEMEFHTEMAHQLPFNTNTGVCKYYRQGRCTRQPCPYRHPKSLTMKPQHQQYTPACKRCQSCPFFANNMCHYFHPGFGVQLPRPTENENQRSEQT